MPLLGFKAEFADRVERGEKTQTIRAYRKDGRDPKVGQRVYLWTGLRQKGARRLGEGIVTKVAPVVISANGDVFVEGIRLFPGELHRFARRDGFGTPGEQSTGGLMVEWFRRVHGLPFRGVVIRWRLTDEREGGA